MTCNDFLIENFIMYNYFTKQSMLYKLGLSYLTYWVIPQCQNDKFFLHKFKQC